ncbi:MAG: CocE/NonD family hydrolase, partial [Acidobacteriaceae bacterium]|nr:CocE/NonD family hydrolase [Acidobacteriaceae bacterium]
MSAHAYGFSFGSFRRWIKFHYLLFGFVSYAAAQSAPDLAGQFTKQDVMIAMRDGIRLHTEIYAPKKASGSLPFLLTRTPYGQALDKAGFNRMLDVYSELARDGYIFVFQDIRGRYGSEGKFVMMRKPHDKTNPNAIDEGTDAYDTIEWLLKNVPNHNGRVGIKGISYGGWLTMMALLDPHPAIKAASEQASPADMFLGDDFHHNGAFRLSYGWEYASRMETTKEQSTFDFDRNDTYEWYLKAGPLSNFAAHYGGGKLPSWNDFVEHPNYDDFWQKQAVTPYLTQSRVPNLNVAGWWDQEDFYGPLKIYETLERTDSRKLNYLVVGPWNHGGWARGTGRKLGIVDFGSDTAKYFREDVEAPWFAYWLKDQGT